MIGQNTNGDVALLSEGGLDIPVVVLVVEGGIEAIHNVQSSLSQNTPVILCKGTGRAADILAFAYNHMSSKG